MNTRTHMQAGVLATVVVVATLLLFVVLALLSLWDADYLLFSRARYQQTQRAHIESVFTLYRNDPGVVDALGADSTLLLYDSLPGSRMRVYRTTWGLYEALSVSSLGGDIHQSCLFGAAEPSTQECNFYYCNNNSSMTLTGNTNLHGKVRMPKNGVVYGQMRSTFFSGEKIEPRNMGKSEEKLPALAPTAHATISTLLEPDASGETEELTDSLFRPFYRSSPVHVSVGTGMLVDCAFAGQVVLYGEEVHIDASCRLDDVIVVADNITVGAGFRGSAQFFARDTIWVEENVLLDLPSGIYAGKYAEIAEDCEVNGFAIVDYGEEKDPKKPNFRQARSAVLRGLLYVDGIGQLQGIVSGGVFIDEAVYYSKEGYYRNVVYDATVLENRETSYPLWMDAPARRKEAKWVR